MSFLNLLRICTEIFAVKTEGGALPQELAPSGAPENEDGDSEDDNGDDQGADEPRTIEGSIYIFFLLLSALESKRF